MLNLPLLALLHWRFLYSFPDGFTVSWSGALFLIPFKTNVEIIPDQILFQATNIRRFTNKHVHERTRLGCKFLNNELLSYNQVNLKIMVFIIDFAHYLYYCKDRKSDHKVAYTVI